MTVAEFIDRDEAVRLNLVAHLTIDDHAKIGRMPTTMLHWTDEEMKKAKDRDYHRSLRVSRTRANEGKK